MKTQNLRIRIEEDVADALDRIVDEQKTTKQLAISTVLRWYCAQDRMVRSLIMEQIPVDVDVAELVLRRMAKTDAQAEIGIIERGRERSPLRNVDQRDRVKP